jgi:hypothetical protein
MRANQRWALGLTLVAASVLGWALLEAALPPGAQRAPGPSDSRSSPVFTTAHPSALGAVRDFFERRPAPVQPVAYTHKVHLANGMQCENCHMGVDQGPDASIPGVKLCMMCHQMIATDRPEIKKIAAYQARGEDIPWVRVYDYSQSAHVKFNHVAHIRAKVACATCHGDMRQQTTAQRVVNLTMGYCIDCHKQRRASIDCLTCHF